MQTEQPASAGNIFNHAKEPKAAFFLNGTGSQSMNDVFMLDLITDLSNSLWHSVTRLPRKQRKRSKTQATFEDIPRHDVIVFLVDCWEQHRWQGEDHGRTGNKPNDCQRKQIV